MEAIGTGGSITLDYEADETMFSLLVSDDGPGITAIQRDKIFEPYYTTKRRGTGLGLTVTRKLIENLFGYIELLPSKRGALFRIKLPIMTMSETKL